MNENIREYLFTYVENPDPRYAVMLKGKWGCGKSFFVKEWLNVYTKKIADNQAVLEPIYISLYGLKETSQITDAIDKVLHPILYSKGVEFTKKLFKFAGKIALRTSIDWDKDDHEDLSFESTLDSLSLFSSKDDAIESKLIVFDDLERCQVDMKQLLGYINNFVEHGACHVIIVGDETHATEESKKTLIEFKEKTVGRELEVLPDNVAAIHYFLNDDVPLVEWLKDKEDFINEIFSATKCDNLRLLRQCLYDFSVLDIEVADCITSRNEWFMRSMLASYIVCYCEYRGEYHDLFEKWNYNYFGGLIGDDNEKSRLSILQSKYRALSDKYKFEVLDGNHIPQIVLEIKNGFSIKQYVTNILGQLSQDMSRQDKLAGFLDMQSEEFNTECDALVEDILSGRIANIYMLGRSLALLVFFDENKMFWMTQATVSLAKKQIRDAYGEQRDKEELYKIKALFLQGVGSFGTFYETTIGKDILEFSNMCFDKCEQQLKNKMELIICNLDDSNVMRLSELSEESTPDHQCHYNMTSVFKKMDAKSVSKSILNMKNTGIMTFCQFMSKHYMFGASLGGGYNRFQDDYSFLTYLKSLIEPECEKRKSVDGYVLRKLVKYLDGAVKRANGDNNPIYV